MPRVSVIIPTFNCERFLGRAIHTALSQTYTDHEVIVVDDGSTDETQKLAARLGRKIRYLYQPNRGASSARNLALSQANGELIAYLDADDMWYPRKLERQVAFLDTHKECGLVHSDMTIIDELDKVIHFQFNQVTHREVPHGYCALDLLRRGNIQTSTVVERRESNGRTDIFDERLPVCQDYLRWILVAMEGVAFGYIDEALAMYRWRAGSLFNSSQARVCEDLRKIFNILLDEKSLALRFGREAAEIIREQQHSVGRELAYLHRIEGRPGRSMRCLSELIWNRPFRIELYVDLLKACVPALVAAKLRLLKTQLS